MKTKSLKNVLANSQPLNVKFRMLSVPSVKNVRKTMYTPVFDKCDNAHELFRKKHMKEMTTPERISLHKKVSPIITVVEKCSYPQVHFVETGPCHNAEVNNNNLITYDQDKWTPCIPNTQVKCLTKNVAVQELDTKTGQIHSKTVELGVKYKCDSDKNMIPIHMYGGMDGVKNVTNLQDISPPGNLVVGSPVKVCLFAMTVGACVTLFQI